MSSIIGFIILIVLFIACYKGVKCLINAVNKFITGRKIKKKGRINDNDSN